MKINKNTANADTYYENITKNTLHIVQELCSQELHMFSKSFRFEL